MLNNYFFFFIYILFFLILYIIYFYSNFLHIFLKIEVFWLFFFFFLNLLNIFKNNVFYLISIILIFVFASCEVVFLGFLLVIKYYYC